MQSPGLIWRFMEDLQTFGCATARAASRAFSRSPAWKGPRRPPPDIGLRGSCRPAEFCLPGAECFLSPAKAEYLGKDRNLMACTNE